MLRVAKEYRSCWRELFIYWKRYANYLAKPNLGGKQMKSNATPFLTIFEKKLQLEVPLFQRQYVWNREKQWLPLWEDISRKFAEALEERGDGPPHFLGAMVLDQKMTPTTYVEKRQIIDGQQRLITFQIFLSAFRDLSKANKSDDLSAEINQFVLNTGMMADKDLEKFKVWPTQLDRDQFSDAITVGSKNDLEEMYPKKYMKHKRTPEPRPLMIEAYLFFYDQLSEFFSGTDSDPPLAPDKPLKYRLETCFQVLKNALQVVVIDLDQDDDAQVIFETLNARGEPLLPADLVRNFIFLRAARERESQEALYEQFWRNFDDDFWRQEIRQGRLFRPRIDLFMQHFLASRQALDIPITHLFVEYKYWIQRKHPFSTVREELATLSRQADVFRRLTEPQKSDTMYRIATFLASFDLSTVYPLLLLLFDAKFSDTDLIETSAILESYLLRRAVCDLTAKNYNRIFLGLIRQLQQKRVSPGNIREYLAGLTGESGLWPSDDDFSKAWATTPIYTQLGNSKLVYILLRLNDACLSNKSEHIDITGPLTIEHIMPQQWLDRWPLPDGSRGLSWEELSERPEGDELAEQTRKRDSLIHTMGNLTILTQSLNSAVSNDSWTEKRRQLLMTSLLPINQQLHRYPQWSEDEIKRRGNELFELAKLIWPAPSVIDGNQGERCEKRTTDKEINASEAMQKDDYKNERETRSVLENENQNCNTLRKLLVENKMSFIPRGRVSLDEVYSYVRAHYPALCDDNYLCNKHCLSGTSNPEWQHAVRWALQTLKDAKQVNHASRGYWLFY